jgi:transcriptional regulator with XRE-family HTH domain
MVATGPATTFGAELQLARLERGLTRKALAARSGLSLVNIRRLEVTTQMPQERTLIALAKGLSLPIATLLEWR